MGLIRSTLTAFVLVTGVLLVQLVAMAVIGFGTQALGVKIA